MQQHLSSHKSRIGSNESSTWTKALSRITPTNSKTKSKILTAALAIVMVFLLYTGFSHTKISDSTTSNKDALTQSRSIERGFFTQHLKGNSAKQLTNQQSIPNTLLQAQSQSESETQAEAVAEVESVAHISVGDGLGSDHGCLNELIDPFITSNFDSENNELFTSEFIASLITDNTQFIGMEKSTLTDFLTKYSSQNSNIFKDNNMINRFRIKEADFESLQLTFSLTYIRTRYNGIDYQVTNDLLIDFIDTNECKIKQITLI